MRGVELGLLPLVGDETLATQLAEQGIKRAFLGRKFGLLHSTQDVGGVDATDTDHLEHGELEQAFADGKLLGGSDHTGTIFKKGTISKKEVNPNFESSTKTRLMLR